MLSGWCRNIARGEGLLSRIPSKKIQVWSRCMVHCACRVTWRYIVDTAPGLLPPSMTTLALLGGTSMQYLHALSMLFACTTDSVVYVSGYGAHITAYRYSHIFFLFCRMSWHSHCYCSSLLASALILSRFGTIAVAFSTPRSLNIF